MNLYSKIFILALFCCALVFASCAGQPAETTDPGGTTGQTQGSETEDTVDTTGGTAAQTTDPAVPELEYYIHGISELNKEFYPLDSAAGNERNSRMELNFRETTTLTGISVLNLQAYYPRIKVLDDGTYIMIFQHTLYGSSIYYMKSEDGLKWTSPKAIFNMTSITIDGVTDRTKYMTPDACVLKNGDIIVVTSYRADKSYQTAIDYNGVAIRRSTDGGDTWEPEQIIYVGTNWEPYIMEADNGEIFVYFTSTAPSIYANGPEKWEQRSSGIAIVRSADGGKTWAPDITGAPYLAQYIMRQHTGTYPDGVKKYTDQMPCAIQLHNGEIALVAESYLFNGGYKLSVCYTDDYWALDLGTDTTGPSNRKTNLFNAAGPYIVQFDSGETLLSYHWTNTMRYRLGNRSATTFYDETMLFTGTGMWGSLQIDSSHSVIASIGLKDFGIQLGRLYLNHAINAKKLTPVLDGKGGEWENNTDALFIGSDSQAQISTRAAYDDSYVYCLIERLDYYLTDGDYINLFIDDGTKNFLMLKIGLDGITQANYYDAASALYKKKEVSETGVDVKIYIDGTKNDSSDKDTGAAFEIAIPRTLINTEGNTAKILLTMQNADGGNSVTDDITGVFALDKNTWFAVNLK